MIEKVAAETEVRQWLKAIRISAKTIDAFEVFVERIAESLSEGLLVINEDNTVTQNLINEMGDGKKTVSYSARYEVGKYQANLRDIKDTDGTGRVIGVLATLSSLPASFFAKMSREDFAVADKLTVFF